MTQTNAANSVIGTFQQNFATFTSECAALVAALESEVSASGQSDKAADNLDDLFWNGIDTLKGNLGSKAANLCSDNEDEQESAIAEVESWVSNNAPATIPLILWVHGSTAGAALIRKEIGTPIPVETGKPAAPRG